MVWITKGPSYEQKERDSDKKNYKIMDDWIEWWSEDVWIDTEKTTGVDGDE